MYKSEGELHVSDRMQHVGAREDLTRGIYSLVMPFCFSYLPSLITCLLRAVFLAFKCDFSPAPAGVVHVMFVFFN